MIVHQSFRNAVLPGDADSIQVERNARQNRIRAGAQTGTDSGAARISSRVTRTADSTVRVERCRFGRVVEAGIEVPHAVIRFVSVRHTVPAQAEVEGQSVVHAPVVLDVHCPGNVVPVTFVLHCEFCIALGSAKQVVGEVISCEGTIEVERTLGLAEEILHLLVDRPTRAEPELVSSLGERNIVTNLVVVGLILPRPTRDFEMCARPAVQVDMGDAVQVVWSSK